MVVEILGKFISMTLTLSQLEMPYTITRSTKSDETDSLGRPIITTEEFEVNMFVHRNKKSDSQYAETAQSGTSVNTFAKVRVLKREAKPLLEGDTFMVKDRKFIITRENLYQDNAVDFWSYIALDITDTEKVVV